MTRSKRAGTVALEGAPTPPAKAAAWLVVNPGRPRERRVAISDRPIRIGSDATADLPLDDPHVSRRHAEIRRTAEGVLLRDLGSRNGTYVGGVIVKEALLAHGATIVVGLTELRFETDAPPPMLARPPVAPPPPDEHPSGPTRFGGAVGTSAAMRRVFALLERIAPTDLTVTLIGETGTGKDVLARAIHAASPRRDGPFVVFDCGAAAPSLIESELFGHEKGAFTGADRERRGAFERASGGTLFLDEIGELSLELQPKLLRALEERRVRRVGGAEDLPVDVRILAATNRDLEEEVRRGRFREDLFFRLSAAIVQVPPLRARLEDLPEIVAAILADAGYRLVATPETLEVLRSYDWPGNVRELRNVLLGATAMAEGDKLEPKSLIFFRPRRRDPTIDKLPLAGRSLESLERAAIEQTLRHCQGNKTKAARALGIAPSTLYEKIKKYGM